MFVALTNCCTTHAQTNMFIYTGIYDVITVSLTKFFSLKLPLARGNRDCTMKRSNVTIEARNFPKIFPSHTNFKIIPSKRVEDEDRI